MATLNFKGKTFVQNYHLTVPFHQLVPDRDKGVSAKPKLDDNLIIHGDNLAALKALLPTYAGMVKCIYIDPPYNTGNERWVYNDNVNSPMIQEWLGKVVDKEDLTRHDKWLCMMMPRLKILRELLRDDGVIFISIDDHEVDHLRLLMDEVYGEDNFIACIVAQLNPRGRTLDRYLAKTYEYILLYSKNSTINTSINLMKKTGKQLEEYDKEDQRGKYRELELRNRNPVFNRSNRPNLYYPIYVDPKTADASLKKTAKYRIKVLPEDSKGVDGCWTWGKDKVSKNLELLIGRQASTGAWRIYRKDYSHNEEGEVAVTKAKALWLEKEVNNEKGKEVCNQIFSKCPFDFPKAVGLVKKCIELGANKEDIILDSFAGSATTAHAVLELNLEDSGNRRFILIECEDYADKVTAERVRRVIKGIPKSPDETLRKGLGGTFSYFELGKPIEVDSILEGKSLPDYIELARYVFYTATGQDFDEKKVDEKRSFIGSTKEYEVYLLYQPNVEFLKGTALTLERARALGPAKGKRRLVFAPTKYLDQEQLDELQIEFAQLPFEIYRRAE